MIKYFLLIAVAISFTACGGDKNGEAAPRADGTTLIKCPPDWKKAGYEYHGFGLCKVK